MHTRRSYGGQLAPGELAAAAREAGLDFLVVTEHHSTAGFEEWAAVGRGLLVICGQEVITEAGHWLAVGLSPGRSLAGDYGVRDDRIEAAIGQVRAGGGLAIGAHPHAPYPSGTLMWPFRIFDAVEVWNGRWRSDLPWNADNEAALAEWDRGLAAGILHGAWRPAVGNSDVHLAGQIGTPQTVVAVGELREDAVLGAIRNGHCWVAESGRVRLDFVVRVGGREAGIGERLAVGQGGAVARLDVCGVPDGVVSLHTERGRVLREVLPSDGAGITEWHVDLGESLFVRAEVRHPGGDMAALTNPIILA